MMQSIVKSSRPILRFAPNLSKPIVKCLTFVPNNCSVTGGDAAIGVQGMKASDKLKVKVSRDGSGTLYSEVFNSFYHSTHGAVQETEHVFIAEGLNRLNRSSIRVLEMGFGTGLNTLLLCLESQKRGIKMCYESIELYPIQEEVWKGLMIGDLFSSVENSEYFEEIHRAPWNEMYTVHESFELFKIHSDILETRLCGEYDLVIYDAFGPGTQPELWAQPLFNRLYAHMSVGAVLSTYCSKGDVRRAMLAVGFEVLKVPGPPGKREMLVAIK